MTELILFMVALSCLCFNGAMITIIFQTMRKSENKEAVVHHETPEEKEAQRIAQEAQQLMQKGWEDMMAYDGRPQRKERDGL